MLSGLFIVRIAILPRRSTLRNSPTPLSPFGGLTNGAIVAQCRDPRCIIADICQNRIGIRADLRRRARQGVSRRRIARRRGGLNRAPDLDEGLALDRSEEHTSELQSLMRNS